MLLLGKVQKVPVPTKDLNTRQYYGTFHHSILKFNCRYFKKWKIEHYRPHNSMIKLTFHSSNYHLLWYIYIRVYSDIGVYGNMA